MNERKIGLNLGFPQAPNILNSRIDATKQEKKRESCEYFNKRLTQDTELFPFWWKKSQQFFFNRQNSVEWSVNNGFLLRKVEATLFLVYEIVLLIKSYCDSPLTIRSLIERKHNDRIFKKTYAEKREQQQQRRFDGKYCIFV